MRAALILAALASACSIESRSQDYTCTTTSECADGRVCVQGWCVVGSPGGPSDGGPGAIADAAPPAPPDAGVTPDASSCPPPCTSCEEGVCLVECLQSASCTERIVCPFDLACEVVCAGVGSCLSGIDCTASRSCDVSCTARSACFGSIECGAGPCRVECGSRETCATGIDCSDSCACETSCRGLDSCGAAPECPSDRCTDGIDCTAEGSDCDVCD